MVLRRYEMLIFETVENKWILVSDIKIAEKSVSTI